MITQDYITGYISALKTVQDNIVHRKALIDNLSTSEANAAKNELIAINAHIEQIKESYRQLVKSLNKSIF